MLHIIKDADLRVPRLQLQRLFADVVRGEAKKNWHAGVNLVLTGDGTIRALNRQYRQKDKTTDVLSFTVDSPGPAENTFGEIYISVPVARRQATDYGATLTEELLRLTCHGLLHLFGYDHIITREAELMRAREARYQAGSGQ